MDAILNWMKGILILFLIGHVMLYIKEKTENGSAMRADDLTRKGDARYVRFAVSGAPACWRLDRAVEAQ